MQPLEITQGKTTQFL